jgi:peptidyl-prolyl cis-trans isomerase C
MFFQKKWILAGLAITCLSLMAVTRPARSDPPATEPLAFVDNKPITVAAFQALMARRPAQMTTPEQRTALLEEMVRFELLYAAALKAGYDKDPEILASLKRLMANKYRDDLLSPRFEKIEVSDKEMEEYYKKHEADFLTPKMVRAAIIQISMPVHASNQKKTQLLKRAEAARTEALKLNPDTQSFGPVAVEYSDHQPTRYRGGDTGWLQPDKDDRRWPDKVMEAVFSLKETGNVSPVITTPTGYYLVKLMERRESAPRPYAAVKERIRHQLLTQKKAEVEREFYEQLKERVPVRVDHARLEAIEPPMVGTDKEAKQPPGLPGQ